LDLGSKQGTIHNKPKNTIDGSLPAAASKDKANFEVGVIRLQRGFPFK